MTAAEQLTLDDAAAGPRRSCTPFPDGRLCADPECSYGGAYDTHWCEDVSDMVPAWLPPRWRKVVLLRLDGCRSKTAGDLRAAWEQLERRGLAEPGGGKGWHHALAHLRYFRAQDAAEYVWGGRCRSGARWFWFASVADHGRGPDGPHCADPVCSPGLAGHECGWEDTEDEAVTAYAEACVRLGGMDPRLCRTPGPPGRQAAAADALKRINSARRRARPPKPGATSAAVVEYLYEPWSWSDDYGERHKGISEIPVTKKTAKRIYYDITDRWDERDGVVTLGFISREDLETDTRCRASCPRDIPAGPVCAAHGRGFRHCAHFGQDSRSQSPRCWVPPGCGQDCPLDTPGRQCAEHGCAWDHCPHGENSCHHGYPAGQARRPGSHWYGHGGMFFATREAAEEYLYSAERERERQRQEAGPELKRLRREMAAVHPDRGGTNEELIAARKRYEEALRRAW